MWRSEYKSRNCFSPSTVWIPRIELGSSGRKRLPLPPEPSCKLSELHLQLGFWNVTTVSHRQTRGYVGAAACAVSRPAYRPALSVFCVRTWPIRPGETFSLFKLTLNCMDTESLCVCLFSNRCACESKLHLKISVILERADVGIAHETLMPFTNWDVCVRKHS